MGKVRKTPHFWLKSNTLAFYLVGEEPELGMYCRAGIFQADINTARIILFCLQMFMLQSCSPLCGQKCVTFKEKHTQTERAHRRTYIHTYIHVQCVELMAVPSPKHN